MPWNRKGSRSPRQILLVKYLLKTFHLLSSCHQYQVKLKTAFGSASTVRSCLFSLLCTSSTLSLEYGRKLKEFCFPLPATPLYFGIRKIIYFLGRSLNSHWTNRCLTLVSRITFHLSCGDCSCTLLSGREVVTDI